MTFPPHVIELCLAHTVGNITERAYRRSELPEKRRRLMAAWAKHLARAKPVKATAELIPIRGVA